MNRSLAPGVKRALLKDWEPVSRSRLHYRVRWSTRGAKPVLRDRHVHRLGDLIARLCEDRGIPLVQAAFAEDRVQLLLGLRPTESVAAVVREIKSRAGLDLLAEFPELRVWLGGNLLWDDRYDVETVSTPRLPRLAEPVRTEGGEGLAKAS